MDTVVLACALVSFWKAGTLAEAIGVGGDRLVQLEFAEIHLVIFVPWGVQRDKIAAFLTSSDSSSGTAVCFMLSIMQMACLKHRGSGDQWWESKSAEMHFVGVLWPGMSKGTKSNPF
jgi:hypothetical protein